MKVIKRAGEVWPITVPWQHFCHNCNTILAIDFTDIQKGAQPTSSIGYWFFVACPECGKRFSANWPFGWNDELEKKFKD